ncbi:uncharacterized protein LOC130814099 [Amaranthus tricolor]|uniref:uncharacterized protein LOC130814099 n=1 Tax=Amaranthus tricolor TaxID=29722 RepID=UPI00258C2B4E|nr:uncharacterized protein LOC130814099 [Amaranthus tricolor]XP_057536084.1 uncharacterized protein LOC130814099 [Amaranthus tricolor]
MKSVKQIMNSGAGQHLSSLKLSTPNHPVLAKSQSDTFGDYTSKSEANTNNEEASPRALSLGTHLRVKHSSPSRFTLDTLIAQRNSKRHKEIKNEDSRTQKEKLQEEECSSAKKGDELDEEESKRKNIDGNDEEDNKGSGGVSVKEYLKTKLEPGEDERALRQVITEVISPRRNPNEKGIVEKVRAAVTMLIQAQEPSFSSSSSLTKTQIPVSTNACEVEEENHGRMLQSI